jgi:hypothetical protein
MLYLLPNPVAEPCNSVTLHAVRAGEDARGLRVQLEVYPTVAYLQAVSTATLDGLQALCPQHQQVSPAADGKERDAFISAVVAVAADPAVDAFAVLLALDRLRKAVEPVLTALLSRLGKGRAPGTSGGQAAGQAQPAAGQLAYRSTPAGLVWDKPAAGGGTVETLLTTFSAEILGDVAYDDGAEVERRFEVEASVGGRTTRFPVPVRRFAGLEWATEYLGHSAVVYPGYGFRDHARAAIQLLSQSVVRRTVYGHTGFRSADPGDGKGERLVYLHAGGALGADGAVAGIEVELGAKLAPMLLPDPKVVRPDVLGSAVRTSLDLLTLVPARLSGPALGSAWRAVLMEAAVADTSVCLVGDTGLFKTELAAGVQQHFGAGFDRLHLPANWESTDNSLEKQAHQAKDMVLLVDDFVTGGTVVDVAAMHRKAARVFRGAGNHAGRGRMTRDGRLQPEYFPRGLILSSGEEVPQRGASLLARLAVLEVGKDDISEDAVVRIQEAGRDGTYALAMAGYIVWLIPRLDDLRERLPVRTEALRDEAAASAKRSGTEPQHRRIATTVAHLAAGWEVALAYALDVGAITPAEREAHWQRAWAGLLEMAAAQAGYQDAQGHVRRFLELLIGALASGKAHLAKTTGQAPTGFVDDPRGWGWRSVTAIGADGNPHDSWIPLGDRIGWLDDGPTPMDPMDVYLEPAATYAIVQRMGRDGDGQLPISARTLWKRLDEAKLLKAKEDEGVGRKTVRKSIGGSQQRVLYLDRAALVTGKPANVAVASPKSGLNGLSGLNGAAGPAAPGSGAGQTAPPASPQPDAGPAGVG